MRDSASPRRYKVAFNLPADRPALMGILNVTPDSFSDGGLHFGADAAVSAALEMMEQGADLIDVGGESTRPGSEGVALDEELRRVMPVIERLCMRGVPVSVDTAKSEVARRALQEGASVVNDISSFDDPEMAGVCSTAECTVCLMHMQGTPRTMQNNPSYSDVVADVREFLLKRASTAVKAGISAERIWLDPGIGFGKTVEHNLKLLRGLDELVRCGFPVLVGTSRKSFIGKVLGGHDDPLPSDQRLEGTLATQIWAQVKGAAIIRAHDVKESRRAIEMTAALLDVGC